MRLQSLSNMVSPGRVLLVDEHGAWRDHVARKLRLRGHSVEPVGTIDGAQEALKVKRAPNFIVIDIDFPGLAGLTFLERVPASVVPAGRIIAFASERIPQVREALQRLGVLTYLLKSDHTSDEIAHRVELMLESGVGGGGGGVAATG